MMCYDFQVLYTVCQFWSNHWLRLQKSPLYNTQFEGGKTHKIREKIIYKSIVYCIQELCTLFKVII